MTPDEHKAAKAARNRADYMRRKGITETRVYRGWHTCQTCHARKPAAEFPDTGRMKPCAACLEMKRLAKQARRATTPYDELELATSALAHAAEGLIAAGLRAQGRYLASVAASLDRYRREVHLEPEHSPCPVACPARVSGYTCRCLVETATAAKEK